MTHTTRTLAYASLLLLGLLAGCPKKQGPNYDAIRQDSERSHKSMDQEKGMGE